MTETLVRGNAARGLKFGFAALAVAALAFGGISPANAAGSVVGPNDVAGFENGAEGTAAYNYDQWHIGSTTNPDATVEQSLAFGECSVTFLPSVGDASVTQLLKGFPVDGRPTANGENGIADVQALIESISIDVAQGEVTLQLPTFIYWDGEAPPEFTTFRNEVGFGPGVHTIEAEQLVDSGGVFDGITVAELLEIWEDDIEDYGDIIEILGVGMTGSDGAIVNSISFAGNTYTFGTGCSGEAPVTPVAPKPPVTVHTGIEGA